MKERKKERKKEGKKEGNKEGKEERNNEGKKWDNLQIIIFKNIVVGLSMN